MHARLRNFFPLRFRMSGLQFAALLLGALVAVYSSMKEDLMEHFNNLLMFDNAILPILALVYLFAFLRRNRELFSFFNTLFGYRVGFRLSAAIFMLYILFVRPDEMLASCVNGSSMEAVMDVCQKMIKDLKPGALAGFCAIWIEICVLAFLLSEPWLLRKSGGESTKKVDSTDPS
ncbi:hypothetical protein B0H19DRAFT_1122557 [Mycena capillaripes]|nr:hypothetical protein B0H19DRAFT_1122557 [Mycena capillaripes]